MDLTKILFCGLQGSGKTTSVAKLAYYIKKESKKKILLVSADIYRPAAQDQLKILSEQVNVHFFDHREFAIGRKDYKRIYPVCGKKFI